MLPVTKTKVWLFWVLSVLGLVIFGLTKYRVIPLPEGFSSFLSSLSLGFNVAVFPTAIIYTIIYLRRVRASA